MRSHWELLSLKKQLSDIRPQNAPHTKHAFGAGDGDCLDVLLHPRGRREALHPLKDVPQGINHIFVKKPSSLFPFWWSNDFSRTSLARLCWSLGEVLALEGLPVSSPCHFDGCWIMMICMILIIIILNPDQNHLCHPGWEDYHSQPLICFESLLCKCALVSSIVDLASCELAGENNSYPSDLPRWVPGWWPGTSTLRATRRLSRCWRPRATRALPSLSTWPTSV